MFKVILLTLFSIKAFCGVEANITDKLVDKIIIKKSVRMLYLSANGKIFKGYHISLGRVPEGAKVKEGDMKTPEGVYVIDWRQFSKKYNKSLHISYPNKRDKERAKKLKVRPGGMIMIHGTPPHWSLSPIGDWLPMLIDWTEGCIALSNEDINELWEIVPDGVPVYIIP